MNLFQNLGLSIEQIVNAIRQAGTSDKIAELMVLFSIIITLVIMYKGYEVLMGKSQSPIRELTFDIAGKLLAITFALNLGGWLDLVIGAMDGIYEWAGGGTNLYQNLDQMFANTSQLTNAIWAKASGFDTILAVVSMSLCYIAFCIAVIPILSILVVTTFTQTLLITSAPIVFWLLIFKATQSVFTQWIGLLLSNTLVLLLVGLFLKTFMGEISGWISILSSETQTGTEVLGTSIFYVIASCILVILIFTAKTFAEKVANVSMEGAMGSAMSKVLSPIGQLAGRYTGQGLGEATNLTSSATKYASTGISAGAKKGYSFAKKMYERMRNEA